MSKSATAHGHAPPPSSRPPPPTASSARRRRHAVSREVMDLLSPRGRGAAATDSASTPLPPMVPASYPDARTYVAKDGTRVVRASRRWVWDSFRSSARSDGLELRHWVRAGVEYPDYPYARFNVHLERTTYTDEEYAEWCENADDENGQGGGGQGGPPWTRADTDVLFRLAHTFGLRWPVIHDRWKCLKGHRSGGGGGDDDDEENDPVVPRRDVHHLQHRYYSVCAALHRARLMRAAAAEVAATEPVAPGDPDLVRRRAAAVADRQAPIADPSTGTSDRVPFSLSRETERRRRLEAIWNRPKAEEEEEEDLRRRLREVEAEIRRAKRAGAHKRRRRPAAAVDPAAAAVSSMPSAADFAPAFAATAPLPTPGLPYQRSARLATPATGGHAGLNRSLIRRMDAVLKELGLPDRPDAPTGRVCDLYDAVRKNTLLLVTLEKTATRKEEEAALWRRRASEAAATGGVVATSAAVARRTETKDRVDATSTSGNDAPRARAGANAASASTTTPTTTSTTTTKNKAKSKKRSSSGKSRSAADDGDGGRGGSSSAGGSSSTKKGTKRKSKKASAAQTASSSTTSTTPSAPVAGTLPLAPAPVASSSASAPTDDHGGGSGGGGGTTKTPSKKRARKS